MKQLDDYNWETYSQVYKEQIENCKNKENMIFLLENLKIEKDEPVFNDHIGDVAKELYHNIITRKIKSVIDCGCGSAYHLHNLISLNPNLQATGIDLLPSQINMGKEYLKISELLNDKLIVGDLSDSDFHLNAGSKLKSQFVYSIAVIMHLAHHKAVNIVRNMSKMAEEYIFLIESPTAHNWPEVIKESGALETFDLEFCKGKYCHYTLLTKRT